MIPIRQLHYELDLSVDKVASLDNVNLNVVEKDAYIWRGIKKWYKDRYDFEKDSGGFETNQKRIDNLADLHILSPSVQIGVPSIPIGNDEYEVVLGNLTYPYVNLTKVEADITRTNCSKKITCTFNETDDVLNSFSDPSYRWSRVPFYFGKNRNTPANFTDITKSIFLKSDGSFAVSTVYVSYLKYPIEPYYGGYNHINGIDAYQSGAAIDCDIDRFYLEDIVEYAVKEIKRDFRDPTYQQAVVETQLSK